jgi:hypothetical protein
MCCKVLHIAELEKRAGQWCAQVQVGKGCGSYDARPATCRSYYCMWMQDRSLGPEWKPDRAKFVVHWQRNGQNLQVAVDPSFPNAWMKEPYYSRLKRLAREGAEHGRFVFVRIGLRLIAVLPDRDDDIGIVDFDDDVLVSRRSTPMGYNYAIEIVRRGGSDARMA